MLAVINARINTVTNGVIEKGTLLVKDGKIAKLGADVQVPEGAKIIDAAGRTVTPGIVEAHCHAGINEKGLGAEGRDANEATSPITPWCNAKDAINMLADDFNEFREAGITTAGVLPGSANLLGGIGVAVKLKKTSIVDEAVIKETGMKSAYGENPKGAYGRKNKSPSTRMGNAAVMREALLKAQQYLRKKEAGENPKFNKSYEAMIPVMKRELPLIIHCHRADDIVTAVRVCKEFNLRYVLEHVTEGYLIVDFFVDNDIDCAVGPTMHYGSKVENKERDFRTPILFAREGVKFCFTTDHSVVSGRHLRTTAGIAVSRGMSEDLALKAITINSARHIGLQDQVGSLEVGKDADFVVWSGHPLAFTTFADLTVVEGKVVYEREVL
ncbi:amidohydrolase [Clostridium sp. 'deep sea']|uniref:amidohydrolase n=1 Tax=Clostridium sp. 'deep sea' TaxID=2779445 RepID=UPI00189683CD|nr:amidohydrolase [Clostridium sp. 'deep sea']QOR36616.1 amidohydrolase [Clostridium sp. 'deep sea']